MFIIFYLLLFFVLDEPTESTPIYSDAFDFRTFPSTDVKQMQQHDAQIAMFSDMGMFLIISLQS